MMEENVLSVTELNQRVKLLIDGDPVLSGVYVRGELSNYKIYPSGHHYFTLKDADSSLRCVMFRGSAAKLRFRPESGMGVTAFGRVSVYPRDGAYQLYVEELMPEGMGDLQVAFEQLKEKLRGEGLFDGAHKKPLPEFPQKIAVITSSAGAAVHDIIRILGKRWPMAEVLLLPVRVQGAEAPPEIAGAIKYANRHHVADVIITGRGGGSIEDLWAFNDERVARAIYDSEIPVISAVGHEPDVTISDYVADVRAATPSNAAELAVPDRAEIAELLANLDIRRSQAMKKKLAELSSRLADLESRRVMQSPAAYLDTKKLELDRASDRLVSAFQSITAQRRREYVRLAASLDAMSPLKVLSRGYAIAQTEDGAVLKSVNQAAKGEKITVELGDGSLGCRIENVEERNNG
jgi:exodeoxyribonuclease VII large subunit